MHNIVSEIFFKNMNDFEFCGHVPITNLVRTEDNGESLIKLCKITNRELNLLNSPTTLKYVAPHVGQWLIICPFN